MFTINVNQLAHAVNTCTQIVPLRIVHLTVHGEESWLVYNAVKDCVKHLFPCKWFTSESAVMEYCNIMDIDRQNVITEYFED